MKYIRLSFLLLICFAAFTTRAQNANGVQTNGTDFWLGFMVNGPPGDGGGNTTEVFVSAEQDTDGVLEIPAQGYSQPFSVTANSVSILTVPLVMAEHTTNEEVDNKGIHIVTEDTVSVLAVNRQEASHDDTYVLTTPSLGTHYRITSREQSFNFNDGSQFLIVATEDDTEIEITPTYETLDGVPAGVPFMIELDAGESYQVRSNHPFADYTGSTIHGIDDCKPFAVFSGTRVGKLPSSCPSASDHLFTQAIPVNDWETDYLAVPFLVSTVYTLRILADEDNTAVSIDGVDTYLLNAGEFVEINDISVPQCISGDKPIAVTQFMQSWDCSNPNLESLNGDPSMCRLNGISQKVQDISFSTSELQNLIELLDPIFAINIIASTDETDNISLDGTLIDQSEFSTFPGCADYSYARTTIAEGIHNLEAPDGVMAYVYGMIQAESFLYSVGTHGSANQSSSATDSLMVDCTTDSLLLTAANGTTSTYWYLESVPGDTLGTGPELLLTETFSNGLYIASSCSSDEYFYVEVEAALEVSVTPEDTLLCLGDSLQIVGMVESDTSAFDFSWSPTDGLDNPNVLNPLASPEETTTYTLTVQTSEDCISEKEVTIEVNDMFELDISASQDTVCSATEVNLNSSFMTAQNSLEFFWQPAEGLSDPEVQSPTATVTEDITYSLTITNSMDGCTVEDEIDLFAYENYALDAGDDLEVCSAEEVMLNATTDAQGSLTWQWSHPGLLDDATIPDPALIGNQGADFEVTLTDGNGCTQTDSVFVTILNDTLDLGGDIEICVGDSAVIQSNLISTSYTYNWSTNESSQSIVVDEPGLYELTVETQEGCELTDNVQVSFEESLDLNLGPDIGLCRGDTATLSVSASASDYVWSTGETSASIQVESAGTYVVTASLENCSSSDSVTVQIEDFPQNVLPAEVSFCFEECPKELELNAGNPGYDYLWSDSRTAQSIQIEEPGTYSVEVTSSFGCERTFATEVFADCAGQLFVPNAFTPNEDGINDVFGAVGAEPVQDFKMEIWNRWGELIWSTKNQDAVWNGGDGTGDYYVQNEVYSYTISYKVRSNCNSDVPLPIEKTGSVTVIR